MENGYNMKRYYILDARKEVNGVIITPKMEVENMQIENANDCRIVEAQKYYEKCEILQQEGSDILNENIEIIIKQLEELKGIVNGEQEQVVQNTIDSICHNDKSKIVEGLKGIAQFGKEVLTSVVSDALVIYMTKYGVLPPI